MAIVSLDTSGQIPKNPHVWIVAVRKTSQQVHTGAHIDSNFIQNYRNCTENWVEKLYAALLFTASNRLLRSNDIIQIDKDFQGSRAEHVKRYMERLFGYYNYGTDRSKPIIQFIPERYSKQVKEADIKSKKARHGQIQLYNNPDVSKEFQYLAKDRN